MSSHPARSLAVGKRSMRPQSVCFMKLIKQCTSAEFWQRARGKILVCCHTSLGFTGTILWPFWFIYVICFLCLCPHLLFTFVTSVLARVNSKKKKLQRIELTLPVNRYQHCRSQQRRQADHQPVLWNRTGPEGEIEGMGLSNKLISWWNIEMPCGSHQTESASSPEM